MSSQTRIAFFQRCVVNVDVPERAPTDSGGPAFSGSLSPWERVGVRVVARPVTFEDKARSDLERPATPLTPGPSPRRRGEADKPRCRNPLAHPLPDRVPAPGVVALRSITFEYRSRTTAKGLSTLVERA